ncbi:MAG: NUDIX hydrolase [Actinomycetota bacterium]|nr:NUDIX hydrolase [Actinomycetota bacterium]
MIEHPPSVVIVAVVEGGLVVVEQPRPGANGLTVELPAGCIEDGEDGLACAARELAEECSLGAARWRSLGTFWAAPAYSTERVEVFEARELQTSPGVPDPDEQLTVRTLSLSELPGALSDATSIAAFALWVTQNGEEAG